MAYSTIYLKSDSITSTSVPAVSNGSLNLVDSLVADDHGSVVKVPLPS